MGEKDSESINHNLSEKLGSRHSEAWGRRGGVGVPKPLLLKDFNAALFRGGKKLETS